jgi:hypothetical protein
VDVISGNNGTLMNGATFAAGEVGQAFSFTNKGAEVYVGNPASLQLEIFTIELWFRRYSSTQLSNDPNCGNGWLFGYSGPNARPGGGYGFHIEDTGTGSYLLALTETGYNHLTGGPSITDTNWHHGAVTWSGTTAVFYLDGIMYPRSACSTFNSPCFQFSFTTPAAIGSLATPPVNDETCTFNGEIDEVSVYDRVLSATEIASIYEAGKYGKCLPSTCPNIVGTWSGQMNVVDPYRGYSTTPLSVHVTDQSTNGCLVRGFLAQGTLSNRFSEIQFGWNPWARAPFTGTIVDQSSVSLNVGGDGSGKASAVLDMSQTPPVLTNFVYQPGNGSTIAGGLTEQPPSP